MDFFHRGPKTLSESKKIAQTQLFSSFKSISFARDRNKNRQGGLSGERRKGGAASKIPWDGESGRVGQHCFYLLRGQRSIQLVLHLFGLKVINAIDVRSP